MEAYKFRGKDGKTFLIKRGEIAGVHPHFLFASHILKTNGTIVEVDGNDENGFWHPPGTVLLWFTPSNDFRCGRYPFYCSEEGDHVWFVDPKALRGFKMLVEFTLEDLHITAWDGELQLNKIVAAPPKSRTEPTDGFIVSA